MTNLEKCGFQKATTVCSNYFKDKHPTEDHLIPTENLGYGEARQIKARRKITKFSPKIDMLTCADSLEYIYNYIFGTRKK